MCIHMFHYEFILMFLVLILVKVLCFCSLVPMVEIKWCEGLFYFIFLIERCFAAF